MTDIFDIPKPMRNAPTNRRATRIRLLELQDREDQGISLYGVPLDKSSGPVSAQALLSSARIMHKLKMAKKAQSPNIKPKERCI